jgi:tRNA 2-thiouridine synthesizing protein A
MDHPVDVTIDAKGQKCPLPVLLAARGIKDLQPGQLMLVEATDSGSRSDIPAWAKDTGNVLVEASSHDDVFRYLIRKA